MVLPPVIPDHELLRLIGCGAYGEVWLARNVMGLMRAVKVVRRDTFGNDRPFEREFAAVKRYEPVSRKAAGLVHVLHAGRAADGSHFHYVMELADAAEAGVDPATEPDRYVPCTLRTQIGRMGQLPVSDCMEVAVSLANGITDLHRVGLVHRDVKPSNIIFVAGRAKLADIGLVGDISDSRSYVGTEGYVPPEGPGQPGADLYSLGRVLYEMATGFESTRFPALPADWVRTGSTGAFEFYEIVLRCGEPDAARRYQTGEALLADLTLLQSGQSVRQVRQMRGMIGMLRKTAVAAVAAGTMATAVAWWQRKEARAQRLLVERAEKAEAEATRNLYAGLVQQARNARLSGVPDGRFTALDLLEKASRLNSGDAAMREEFISTLATPGLRQTGMLSASPLTIACDPALTSCLLRDAAGRWIRHSLPEGTTEPDAGGPADKELRLVRVASDRGTVFAEHSGGRLLSWKHAGAPVSWTAVGAGGCYWSVTPDGSRAVAWRSDGTVTVLHPGDPGARAVWQLPIGFRAGQDFGSSLSADGKRVAFCQCLGTEIRLHALPDGKVLFQLKSQRALSGPVALSADGQVVAAGFEDGGLGIWRTDGTGTCEHIEAGQSVISALAISPDGRFLVSSSWASTSYLWNLADGSRPFRIPLPAGTPVFSLDGKRLVLTNSNGVVCYQFDPAAVCWPLVLPREAIVSRNGAIARFALHPAEPWIIVPGASSLLLYDAARASLQSAWPTPATEAVFSHDGRYLLLGGWACTRIPLQPEADGRWTAGTPALLHLHAPGTSFYQLRTSTDGHTTAGWRNDQRWMILHSSVSGLQKQTLPMALDASESVSLSPDGKWLAHGFRTQNILIFPVADAAKGVLIPTTGAWSNATFSPDGRFLMIGDSRGFRLLRAETWEEVWANPGGGNGGIGRPAWFDPTSRWLLSSTQPGSVTIQNAATGATAVTLHRDSDTQALQVAMSGDGSQVWELDQRTQTMWRWDVHTLRMFLRERGLDWTTDPLPPPISPAAPALEGIPHQ